MKYLEELDIGECFAFDNNIYINTQDFKKNKSRLALNVKTGIGRWLSHETMVDLVDLFIMDKDNNFMPIKEREKLDANTSTKNIS